MSWKVLSTEVVFKTPRFDVVQESVVLPNDSIRNFFQLKMADCSVIMPVTSDGKIVMLNEYRHACKTKLLTLPGGKFEEGDDAIKTAVKELKEETGYASDKMEYIGSFFADPPRTGRKWHFFIARDVQIVSEQDLTAFEDIEIVLMNPAELRSALAEGKVSNLPDMGLIYLGLDRLNFLK